MADAPSQATQAARVPLTAMAAPEAPPTALAPDAADAPAAPVSTMWRPCKMSPERASLPIPAGLLSSSQMATSCDLRQFGALHLT